MCAPVKKTIRRMADEYPDVRDGKILGDLVVKDYLILHPDCEGCDTTNILQECQRIALLRVETDTLRVVYDKAVLANAEASAIHAYVMNEGLKLPLLGSHAKSLINGWLEHDDIRSTSPPVRRRQGESQLQL